MSAPLVTIVTPSYNQGRFLEETIRSVLNQDYPRLEYLVMDGGSTDGSVAILRRYESRLAYWVSEPDRGQTHAIAKGFRRSAGDILTWLNADDVYLSRGAISQAVRACEAAPEAGVVYGDCALMDEAGVVFRLVPGLARVSFRTFAHYSLGQPAAFIRRQVVEAFPLREELRYGMDYEYWLRLSRAGVVFHDAPWLCAAFRVHRRSKTVAESDAMDAELRAIRNQYFNGAWSSRWPAEAVLRRGVGLWLRWRGLRRLSELYDEPLAFDGRRLPRAACYVSQLFARTCA